MFFARHKLLLSLILIICVFFGIAPTVLDNEKVIGAAKLWLLEHNLYTVDMTDE